MSTSVAFPFTLFPPLSLRDDPDGNVESLGHYMARLADCVGLSVGTMTRMLDYNQPSGHTPVKTAVYRSSWICPASSTANLISLLVTATGTPDLSRGTLRNLSPILSVNGFASTRESSSARRWCPRCYLEWEDSSSFEPLYWSFGALTHCPVHECRMMTRCSNCGSKQAHVVRYSKRRQCRSCLAPLSADRPESPASTFEKWVSHQCIQTAQAASSLAQPIPADSFDRYFARVLARWSEGEPVPRHVRASIQNLWTRWNKGERLLRPTMTQYLNFASSHGTSVEEIMVSPESAAAEPLIEGISQSFQRFSLCRPLKGALDSLERALDRLIGSDIPLLPSVTVISRAFDINMRYVRERKSSALLAYNASIIKQRRGYGKYAFGRAFCCAVFLVRSQKGDPVDPGKLAKDVSLRARCNDDVARCAAFAALLVCPCFVGENSHVQTHVQHPLSGPKRSTVRSARPSDAVPQPDSAS